MSERRGTLTYGRLENGRTSEVTTTQNSTVSIEETAAQIQSKTFSVEVRKKSERALQEEPAWRHVMAMIDDTTTKKWKLELDHVDGSTQWLYPNSDGSNSVYFKLTGPNTANLLNERDDRLQALKDAAWGPRNQRRNWTIYRLDGEEWIPPTADQKLERHDQLREGMVTYADTAIPTDEMVKAAFKDMYDADNQIERVVTILRSSIESDFRFRSHVILLGAPGCGKSYTLELLKRMLDVTDDQAVMMIDGTAMTSAGIIDILKDIETMPRFLFIEEIDKADANAVQVLLGMMDRHGEIRKTTYRDKVARDCRVCVFATANSLSKVQNMQSGALWSRFGGNAVTYKRPSDEQLTRILHRELDAFPLQVCKNPTSNVDHPQCEKCGPCKVRQTWIKRTIDWCHKWEGKLAADTLDPRFVIDFCLNGRERLLDNRYLAIYENTMVKLEEAELADWR